MTDNLVTITRATVKRGWTEFEPKVITGLLTGSIGAFIVSTLPAFGIHPTSIQAQFITTACYFLGSYFTPSSGMVVTTANPNGDIETKTTGHAVVTATGAIPVQPPVEQSTAASSWVAQAVQAQKSNHDGATQVLSSPNEIH